MENCFHVISDKKDPKFEFCESSQGTTVILANFILIWKFTLSRLND